MSGHGKILVVEDEDHMAVGIKYNLEAEGYVVEVVPTGQLALELLERDSSAADVVILDIMLPGMSGYTVCESLRARESNIPILLLSARTLPEDRARGFDVGADQYLTKPFDLDELYSRVRNLMKLADRYAEKRAQHSRQVEFGEATVDFDTHEVTVRGEPVRMTKLELKLLEHFVLNQDRVIPREELLENVWHMPAHINTRAPDQFISRLRKTFERDPASPQHFVTVRDVGYRFVGDAAKTPKQE